MPPTEDYEENELDKVQTSLSMTNLMFTQTINKNNQIDKDLQEKEINEQIKIDLSISEK